MSDATSPAPLRLAPTMFREYDLRGRVPEIFPDAADELSDEGMRTLGKAFGTLMKERERQRVVVAHDLRTYSPRLAACFLEGLVTTGVDVTDIGLGLSPTLYFATLHLDCPAGVMITASHNPQGWSGLKMSLDYVQTMLRPDIERLQAIAESGHFATGQGTLQHVDLRAAYLDDLVKRVAPRRRLKVVLDPGNGTAAAFCVEAFERAGFDVVPLFCEPDPTFPNHFPNPSEVAARSRPPAPISGSPSTATGTAWACRTTRAPS